MLLQIALTALLHDVLSDKLFKMLHVMPGFAFVVFVGFHIVLNRKTAKTNSVKEQN